jgi:hypothetical protein
MTNEETQFVKDTVKMLEDYERDSKRCNWCKGIKYAEAKPFYQKLKDLGLPYDIIHEIKSLTCDCYSRFG